MQAQQSGMDSVNYLSANYDRCRPAAVVLLWGVGHHPRVATYQIGLYPKPLPTNR